MVAVAVAADNDRVAVATIATDAGTWGNDQGGGGTADEPDFFYQSSTAQSRKVGTSRIGRQYSGGTTRDASTATGTHQHFLFKVNITNYAALVARTTPAAGIKIGSDASNYDEWYVLGNDNYPTAGGWQFIVINPNITGYVDDNTNGTPTLTAIDYYSLLADFSATSKSENVIIDAIDLGRGLKLTGGDGASTDGVWADFLSADEGTAANRWGYIRSLSGIYFVQGELAIGENTSETAVATVFQDTTGQTLVWENGRAATGYYRMRFNLGNATTDIDITGATFDSTGEKSNTLNGEYTATGEDTRLHVTATGTSGALNLIGCTFKNLAEMTLTSVCTLDSCDVQTEDLTQSGAEIFDSVIRTTSASAVATIQNPDLGASTDLRDTEFIQEGSGHAIEFTTGGTKTLTNLTFTGYNASDGNNDSAIYCSAGSGTITIAVAGGSTPSVRAPGMTIVKTNAKTVSVTARDAGTSAAIDAARVLLFAGDGTGDLPYQDTVTITRSGSTASVSHTAHGMDSGEKVMIEGANEDEYNGVFTITNVTTNAYDYTVSGAPASPATGTITATAVILEGTTNVSGVLQRTDFNFTNDQPVSGRVRKGTSSPYYKTSPVSGTITTAGFTTTTFLVKDF